MSRVQMIGEAGYQDLREYRDAELGIEDLRPGMVVAGINGETAASEFDISEDYYTAYPALVLSKGLALREGRPTETVTVQRLNAHFTPQLVVKANIGYRYDYQRRYEWTQFYDLGVGVSVSPMSERTARFVLDHVAPESKPDSHSGLYTEKGLVVAKQLAITAVAEQTLKDLLVPSKQHSPAA